MSNPIPGVTLQMNFSTTDIVSLNARWMGCERYGIIEKYVKYIQLMFGGIF